MSVFGTGDSHLYRRRFDARDARVDATTSACTVSVYSPAPEAGEIDERA